MANASRSNGEPSSPPAELRWCGFTRELLPSYLAFAMRTFGANEYQANPQYPQWLYAEGPAGADAAKDFLLGIDAAGRFSSLCQRRREVGRPTAPKKSPPAQAGGL